MANFSASRNMCKHHWLNCSYASLFELKNCPAFVVLERLLKTYRKDLHHVDLWVCKPHASIACCALWFSIAQLQSWALQSKYIPADFERTEFSTSCFWKYLLFFFPQRNLYYLNTNVSLFGHIFFFTLLSTYLDYCTEKYHLETDVIKMA